MYFASASATFFLLATSIKAAPVDDDVNLLDRADGGYSVRLNDDDTRTVMDFTPLAGLNIAADASPALIERGLEPRASTVCEGGLLDHNNLVDAWLCLMNYVGSGRNSGQNTADFVSSTTGFPRAREDHSLQDVPLYKCKVGSVVVYNCNYNANSMTRDVIQNALTAVSLSCGDLGKGYERCKASCGVSDSTIGRKTNGDDFCWSGFKG
ncbi:putative Cyanovirin-N domain-containing protein [Seiridium cardinale]|uniref:Cyanovirin-N domain-containing protein n=1 Tax=Seiridium cardinale TaxID=138064 RepID=A0ABR2XJR8_9PEZI